MRTIRLLAWILLLISGILHIAACFHARDSPGVNRDGTFTFVRVI